MTDRLRAGRVADFPAMKALWRACFGDPPAFIDAFFAHWRGRARLFVAEREGAIVASLWALPCTLEGAPAAYLYAVAVDPAIRRQGVATALLSFALETLKKAGVDRFWLYPADPALHALYRPLGFAPAAPARYLEVNAALGEAPLLLLTPVQAAARRAELLRNKTAVGWDADALAWAAQSEGGTWYAVGDGLALLCPDGAVLRVPEWLAPDPARAAAFAAALGCKSAAVTFPGWLAQGEPLPPPLSLGAAPAYAGPTLV